MGQLQRDDRRIAQQETIELWEIERERPRALRRGRPQQRRQPRQVRESGREREYQQPRRQPRQVREFEREREYPQAKRQSRQVRESGREREYPQARQPRQVRESGREREYQQPRRQSRQTRQPRQMRRSNQASSAVYRQEKELQFVLPADYRQSGNPRPVQSIKRRRAKRRKLFLSRASIFVFVVLCLVLIYQTTGAVYRFMHRDMMGGAVEKNEGLMSVLSDKMDGKKIAPPEITEDFLDINDYSRPGTKLRKVKNVFVHYTANPGTSAKQNRSYFANLAQTHERSASAHFIIGYEGELIQCIPLNEQAYAVATRNEDSVSIECCYLSKDGSFTPETYETLLHTLAWLLEEYDLTTEDILRHYDCGGKKCPLYYVEHEDAWDKLLADVEAYEASIE